MNTDINLSQPISTTGEYIMIPTNKLSYAWFLEEFPVEVLKVKEVKEAKLSLDDAPQHTDNISSVSEYQQQATIIDSPSQKPLEAEKVYEPIAQKAWSTEEQARNDWFKENRDKLSRNPHKIKVTGNPNKIDYFHHVPHPVAWYDKLSAYIEEGPDGEYAKLLQKQLQLLQKHTQILKY